MATNEKMTTALAVRTEAKKTKDEDVNILGIMMPMLIMIMMLSAFSALEPEPEVGRVPPCGNFGDIDGSGVVSLADIDLVARHISHAITLTDEQLARADVSGSGTVDSADTALMVQYLEGSIDTFPVCSMTW